MRSISPGPRRRQHSPPPPQKLRKAAPQQRRRERSVSPQLRKGKSLPPQGRRGKDESPQRHRGRSISPTRRSKSKKRNSSPVPAHKRSDLFSWKFLIPVGLVLLEKFIEKTEGPKREKVLSRAEERRHERRR